jgi:hypothetical protein
MQRSPLAISILCFGGLIGTGMVAQASQEGRAAPAFEIHARALDAAPQSRVEGDKAMDGAIAAALIGAISEQFDAGRQVGVKLDRLAVAPASPRDRGISGTGRLRIGDDGSWIPFRFRALYDTMSASVSYPYLVLGGGGTGDAMAPDSRLAVALDEHVDRKLAREFAQQPVDLSIARITAAPAGGQYLTVQALGTAEFSGEGSTAAQVRALYDRQSGRWLRVEYELGAAAERVSPRPTVAAR